MRGTKTSLFLVELMISLLLFAFCAAICLQIFNAASEQTRKSEALSKGVFRATEAAELYKAMGGDMDALGEHYGWRAMRVDNILIAYFDEAWEPVGNPILSSSITPSAVYEVHVTRGDDGVAKICVYDRKITNWVSEMPSYSSDTPIVIEPIFSIDVKAVA